MLASPEVPAEIYSPESLANLWVSSYRFSQGHDTLQRGMVIYLAQNVIPKPVLQNDEGLETSFDLALSTINRAVNSPAHLGVRSYDIATIEDDFDSNIRRPVQEREERRGSEADWLLELMLSRDAHFLPVNKHKNPRRFGASPGQYFSYVTRYILLGASATHPAFDTLFNKMRPFLVSAAKSDIVTTAKDLHSLRRTFRSFHLSDILDAHAEDNPADRLPISQTLKELGIKVGTKE
jgi:hypothetical protein